jgi:hypothetical protein
MNRYFYVYAVNQISGHPEFGLAAADGLWALDWPLLAKALRDIDVPYVRRCVAQPGSRSTPKVHFHFIPTRSSWLNPVETWFSILQGQSLNGASLTAIKQLQEHIVAEAHSAPSFWISVDLARTSKMTPEGAF